MLYRTHPRVELATTTATSGGKKRWNRLVSTIRSDCSGSSHYRNKLIGRHLCTDLNTFSWRRRSLPRKDHPRALSRHGNDRSDDPPFLQACARRERTTCAFHTPPSVPSSSPAQPLHGGLCGTHWCAKTRDQPVVGLPGRQGPHNDSGNSAGLFTPSVRSSGLLFVVASSFAGLSRSRSRSFSIVLLSSSDD